MKTRNYLALGFAALYLVFLIACAVVKSRAGGIEVNRFHVIAPLVEFCLYLVILKILFTFNINRKIKKTAFFLLFSLLSVIYLGQSASLLIGGELLSVVAIENWREAQFVRSLTSMACAAVLVAMLLVYFFLFPKNNKDENRKKYYVILLVLLCAFQLKNVKNYSPTLALAKNVYTVACPMCSGSKFDATEVAKYYTLKLDSEYPFLRDYVYNNDVYKIPHQQKPNVIVLFAEGYSAHLIGTYGGDRKFPGLTPNLDAFARDAHVCVVDNYFNHTAATHRGIGGTLASAWPLAGGRWIDVHSKSYQSYPSIVMMLNKLGYETAMFSGWGRLNNMYAALKFKHIYDDTSLPGEILKIAREETLSTEYDGLSDQALYAGLTKYLQQNENKTVPHFIGVYNVGTHAFLNTGANDKVYNTGNEPILNITHNFDYALGEFLNYFIKSPWAKNTYLIITADHARFPEPAYVRLFEQDAPRYFVDAIPLMIYDPYSGLPRRIDAGGRTSIDLAPTILNLLGENTISNAFLGASLFDETKNIPGASIGNEKYLVIDGAVYDFSRVPKQFRKEAEIFSNYVDLYQVHENNDKIYPVDED